MSRLTNIWRRYWYEDSLSWSRLVALRWAVFGLVAFDLWSIMLHHASRYGAGNFNVAQIGLLDALLPIPTPPVISAGVLITGFFALRAAMGVAIRFSMVIATTGYFGIYLWSQADSYQHHYMVGLLMTICCFIPEANWTLGRQRSGQGANEADEPQGNGSTDTAMGADSLKESALDAQLDGAAPSDTTERSRWHWAIRLFYVQMALLYFWTAVTKCDPTWLTGVTMDQVTGEPAARDFMAAIDTRFGLAAGESYRAAAWWTMAGEFFAALVFLIPVLRIVGLLIVPWFHVGVEVLGFDIELFSYYMIALDLILLSPRSFWRALDRRYPELSLWSLLESRVSLTPPVRWMVIAFSTLATGAVCAALPFSASITVAALIGLGTFAALYWRSATDPLISSGVIHILCGSLMLLTVQVSDSAYDYYRMWGGDLKRRGQHELAAKKYEHANELMPDAPARRLQLGRLYERLGRDDDALALYEDSVRIVTAYVSGLRAETHRDPTDHKLQIDLGQNLLRLASRCKALATMQGGRGLSAEAEASRLCELNALSDAEAAAERSVELNPRDQRDAFKLRRQLRKARR